MKTRCTGEKKNSDPQTGGGVYTHYWVIWNTFPQRQKTLTPKTDTRATRWLDEWMVGCSRVFLFCLFVCLFFTRFLHWGWLSPNDRPLEDLADEFWRSTIIITRACQFITWWKKEFFFLIMIGRGEGVEVGVCKFVLQFRPMSKPSVNDFVDGGLLVARTRHDVLVVRRNVTAKHRRRLLRL